VEHILSLKRSVNVVSLFGDVQKNQSNRKQRKEQVLNNSTKTPAKERVMKWVNIMVLIIAWIANNALYADAK